jgi:hypothetical protein
VLFLDQLAEFRRDAIESLRIIPGLAHERYYWAQSATKRSSSSNPEAPRLRFRRANASVPHSSATWRLHSASWSPEYAHG